MESMDGKQEQIHLFWLFAVETVENISPATHGEESNMAKPLT